jgi:hypothetical protein
VEVEEGSRRSDGDMAAAAAAVAARDSNEIGEWRLLREKKTHGRMRPAMAVSRSSVDGRTRSMPLGLSVITDYYNLHY